MPRPTRAYGRPGTDVIPADWNSSHAVVVRKTMRAAVQIFAPVAPNSVPDPDATPTPIYTGAARIQVLNGEQSTAVLGDQAQVTVAYLIVIDRDAPPILINSVVKVTDSDDTTLGGRRIIIRKIARGTERWERDLWGVDDLTQQEA